MNKHEKWEAEWWGDCTNTLGEELKQIQYAQRMGLNVFSDSKSPFNIKLPGENLRILDIGGGPVSMLLKSTSPVDGFVVDPQPIPEWTKKRYKEKGIEYLQMRAEELKDMTAPFDEVWIYNCLQHTVDPQKILRWAITHTKLLRIFEWLDTPPSIGHPHTLNKDMLNDALGGIGRVEESNTNALVGRMYYGIFKGTQNDGRTN